MAGRVVQIEELRCLRLSERPLDYPSEPVRGFGSSIRATHVPDVLYVPDLRLQLIGDADVPTESLQHEWTLAFEIERQFGGLAEQFSAPFECDRSSDEVCVLSNFYSRNFAHFITEELIKVIVLEQAGFTGRYVIARLPPFAAEALLMLGISRERLVETVEQPTIFAAAWYVTPIHGGRAMEFPEVFLTLRERLLAAAAPKLPTRSERVWLERRVGVHNQSREVVNRDEVGRILDAYGFSRIDMATLPLEEQVAVAGATDVLAGPHGAGMVHAFFMAPGSDVIECYSPLLVNPGVIELCLLMRHRYSMLVYDYAYRGYPWGDRLMINTNHLELAIRALDGGNPG